MNEIETFDTHGDLCQSEEMENINKKENLER